MLRSAAIFWFYWQKCASLLFLYLRHGIIVTASLTLNDKGSWNVMSGITLINIRPQFLRKIVYWCTYVCACVYIYIYIYIYIYVKAIRKVSSNFEHLENRWRGLEVTWQPVPDETLLGIREQSLSRGASQSAVRRRWLSLCNVWPSGAQISSLSTAILALGKAVSRREPNLGCRGGADRLGWCDPLPK